MKLIKKQIQTQVWDKTWEHISKRYQPQVRLQVWDHVQMQAQNQIFNQVQWQIRNVAFLNSNG